MKRFLLTLTAFAVALISPFCPVALGVTMRSGAAAIGLGNQDQRPGDWDGQLKMLDPELSKFTYFLMKWADETVDDPKFNQFEDQDIPLWSQVNAGTLTSGTTTIDTDDGTVFYADARVMIPRTGEIFLVGAVSTNQLTGCTRGHSGTSAAALLDNDYLLVLGEIVYEMDTVGTVRTTVPATVYNYCQTFRKAWSASDRDIKTKKRTIGDDVRDKNIALRNMKRDVEHAVRFGTRYTTGTAATSTQMYTGGFEYFVTSNVYQANGQLTEPFLLAVCKDIFTYGTATKKLCFAGPEAMAQLAALGMLADTVISADDKDRNWLGMDIRQFISPFGILDFVWDKTLTYGWADRVHMVDVNHISLATMRGRSLNYKEFSGRNSNDPTFLDGTIGEYLTDRGLKMNNEKVHGIIKGCTKVAPPA